MREVQASAKTRKEAIQKGLNELGVELHEVDIEIVDEGSKGLFGFGARDVKVRVSAEHLPDIPKEKPQRSESRQGQRNGNRKPDDSRGRRRRSSRPAPPRKAQASQGNSRDRDRDRDRYQDRGRKRIEEPQSKPIDAEKAGILANEAAALLKEIIEKMGIEASVSSEVNEEGVRLNVESPDSAILIGRKGRNLNAMQYLINRMVQHPDNEEASVGRLIVDVEDYLQRRKDSLEDLALRLAARAKETSRKVRLKPLNPQERRIIHVTLQDDPDVRTFSVGDTLVRSVIIVPKGAERDDDGQSRRRRGGQGGRGGRGGRGRGRRDYQDSRPNRDSDSNSDSKQDADVSTENSNDSAQDSSTE